MNLIYRRYLLLLCLSLFTPLLTSCNSACPCRRSRFVDINEPSSPKISTPEN